MNTKLTRRVQEFRDDFEKETGSPFNHFYCPILRTDQSAQLCIGHIIPEALKNSNEWVPQRKDVDNFYGSVVQSDVAAFFEDSEKSVVELVCNPKTRRRYRPEVEIDGVRFDWFFPKDVRSVDGHTPIEFVNESGAVIQSAVIREDPKTLAAMDGKILQPMVSHDFAPAIIATSIHSAHLTMFSLMKYRYVFSPCGVYVADVLSRFIREHGQKIGRERRAAMLSYFWSLRGMVRPIHSSPLADLLSGTIQDNRFLACFGGSGEIFAIVVVVQMSEDKFAVFLPNDTIHALDIYSGFLSEPPNELAVRLVEYRSKAGSRQGEWCASPNGLVRIPIMHPDTLT